jgi:hypothetical protein
MRLSKTLRARAPIPAHAPWLHGPSLKGGGDRDTSDIIIIISSWLCSMRCAHTVCDGSMEQTFSIKRNPRRPNRHSRSAGGTRTEKRTHDVHTTPCTVAAAEQRRLALRSRPARGGVGEGRVESGDLRRRLGFRVHHELLWQAGPAPRQPRSNRMAQAGAYDVFEIFCDVSGKHCLFPVKVPENVAVISKRTPGPGRRPHLHQPGPAPGLVGVVAVADLEGGA